MVLEAIVTALTHNEFSFPGLPDSFSICRCNSRRFSNRIRRFGMAFIRWRAPNAPAQRGLGIISLDSAALTRAFTERYRRTWRTST